MYTLLESGISPGGNIRMQFHKYASAFHRRLRKVGNHILPKKRWGDTRSFVQSNLFLYLNSYAFRALQFYPQAFAIALGTRSFSRPAESIENSYSGKYTLLESGIPPGGHIRMQFHKYASASHRRSRKVGNHIHPKKRCGDS